MYKYLLLVLIFNHYSFLTIAQWAIPQQMRAENTLDRLSDKGGLSNSDILYGIPLPPGNVVGDVYLDKKWNTASLLIYDSEVLIEGYPVKYDVKADVIEIKSVSGIKVLDARKVRSMVWVDSLSNQPHYFVNAADYKLDGTPMKGLIEVLVDGKIPLMKKDHVFVKEPTYNVAMGSGSRDIKIYHKSLYYYAHNGELFKINSKKDIEEIPITDESIDEYIKSNKINTGKESGLLKLFTYINSL